MSDATTTPASKILADTLRAAGATRIAWARGTGHRVITFTMDADALVATLPALQALPFPVRFRNSDSATGRHSVANPDPMV